MGPPQLPAPGTTVNGMIKSYNRKGFGFLMVFGFEGCQDIYYSREDLSPNLQTRDIPGQHVSFEINRYPEGRLVAVNIRAIGEVPEITGKGRMVPQRGGSNSGKGQDEEDRSRDWICPACKERNFMKRFECFKCKKPREIGGFSDSGPMQAPTKRAVSPYAGSRAWREQFKAGLAAQDRSGSESASQREKRRKKDSGTSSSSSSDKKKKKKKRKKKK